MNSESGNAVICNVIQAVQELTKSADRKLINRIPTGRTL
jgi:hypothetical protein